MRTAALACVFLLLAGCPKRPIDFGSEGEPKSDADLMQRVRAAELSVTSVKGEAKLKASTDHGAGTAGLFVAVKEPAFIHLEALDFFGRPQAQLDANGAQFGLYDAQAARFSEIRVAWDPSNPLSGTAPSIRDLSGHRAAGDSAVCVA